MKLIDYRCGRSAEERVPTLDGTAFRLCTCSKIDGADMGREVAGH